VSCPGVFLDRDGTISEEVGYLNHVSRFRLLAGAAGAIRRLHEAGYPVIVVTNQSGVGRGFYPESVVLEANELMKRQLKAEGAELTGIYYCPHVSSAGCDCRKPKLGMVTRAAAEHGIELVRSFFVGDRHSDIELGHRAGGVSILVQTGYGKGELAWHAEKWARQPGYVAADLAGAADWILGHTR
jgi:D-glycero-D-manno-heptose 1,7-bisphosphate phosphatase